MKTSLHCALIWIVNCARPKEQLSTNKTSDWEQKISIVLFADPQIGMRTFAKTGSPHKSFTWEEEYSRFNTLAQKGKKFLQNSEMNSMKLGTVLGDLVNVYPVLKEDWDSHVKTFGGNFAHETHKITPAFWIPHQQQQNDDVKSILATEFPAAVTSKKVKVIPGNHDIGDRPTKQTVAKFEEYWKKKQFGTSGVVRPAGFSLARFH